MKRFRKFSKMPLLNQGGCAGLLSLLLSSALSAGSPFLTPPGNSASAPGHNKNPTPVPAALQIGPAFALPVLPKSDLRSVKAKANAARPVEQLAPSSSQGSLDSGSLNAQPSAVPSAAAGASWTERYPLPQLASDDAKELTPGPNSAEEAAVWEKLRDLDRRINTGQAALAELLKAVDGNWDRMSPAENAQATQLLQAWREAEKELEAILETSSRVRQNSQSQ